MAFVSMDRSLTTHPLIYGLSEGHYSPGLQQQFPATPLTPDLFMDDTSHHSSTMSRSTSMVTSYLLGGPNPWSLSSEADDSFMSHMSHVGTSFDNPIMSPPDQDPFQPQPRYSLSSNFSWQDIMYPPVHDMNRSLFSASSFSGIHEAQIPSLDLMRPSHCAMPQTTSSIAEEEPQSALNDESVSGRARKMEVPRSKHIISREHDSGPQRLMCDKCNRKPDGFQGEHELARHRRLFHAKTETKWVCTNRCEDDGVAKCNDWLAPKLSLDACQNCKNGKKYGQYYNAAAQ
jgi:hypothetical protein